MVSYYNSNNMYRHQQAQPNPPVHSWYTAAGYHHQGPHHQMAPPGSYCMQEEQQMWHHAHSVFHNPTGEYQDLFHGSMQQHTAGQLDHNQMPSPTVTVSGSDMSSPGAGSGNLSPHNVGQGVTRPPPARSPFEWIKKTSYQVQPNPGKTRTKDKYRVVYTDHQRIELEKEFTFINKYITIRRKAELAAKLGLSERQIKIWFQNRRAKERKQNKKRIEEKTQMEMSANGMYPPYLPPNPQNGQFIQNDKNHHQQFILGMNATLGNIDIKEKMEKLDVQDDFPQV